MIELGRQSRSLYQKVLLLDNNTRYKLVLIVKDLNSDNVGSVSYALDPAPFGEGEPETELQHPGSVRPHAGAG